MDSSSGSNSSPGYSAFFARMKDCQGCQQRKEYLQSMLTDTRFWVGVAVGVGGVWAFNKFMKKS